MADHERYVEMRCTANGYIGVIVSPGSRNEKIEGTDSNVALICRSKCIKAAHKLGLPYRE